jgi:putative hemolysin
MTAGAAILTRLEAFFQSLQWAWSPGTAALLALFSVIGACSCLFILVGELIPKALVVAHPERWALWLALPVAAVVKLVSPVLKPLVAMSHVVMGWLGVRGPADDVYIHDDDVQWLVREGSRRGVFNVTEQELIAQVFNFAAMPVRKAMTPRTDIAAIDQTWSRERILKFISTEGYSRYPVHAGNIDKIVGVIHTKDVITILTSGGVIIIEDLIRPPMFAPYSQTLGPLLRKMQKQQEHLAIVLDEFGGTAGLVTLEDLLEEIVGDIRDEHDQEEPELTISADGKARIAGSMPVGEFNQEFNTLLDESVADTMAGLLVQRLGRIPRKGDQFEEGGVRFTVAHVKNNRIEWLKGERTVAAPARSEGLAE